MDITAIANQAAANDTGDLPPMVVGCQLQADADIFAYDCCNLEESLDENTKVLKAYIEQQRLMAGCDHINLHLTVGKKGGREEAAKVQEYQANRQDRDPEQQARVRQLREWMATYKNDTTTALAWTDREADDGMAQYQIARIKSHGLKFTKIMTTDKDLRMVPGIHIHPKTYETVEVPDGYGKLYICENTSQKMCKGYGKAFFWAQLLMGDPADNIPGLPKVSAAYLNRRFPTKAILNAKTKKAKDTAEAKRKDGKVGGMRAYEILERCKTNLQAYKRVREAYESYYGKQSFEYTDWRGNVTTETAGSMLLEQAKLLWMQRVPNEDPIEFFKEIVNE